MLLKYTITYDILMSILIGQAVGFKHWHSNIGHQWSPRQVFFRLLRRRRIGTIIRSQQKRRAKIKIIQKRKWKLFYSLRLTQLRRKVWTNALSPIFVLCAYFLFHRITFVPYSRQIFFLSIRTYIRIELLNKNLEPK